MKQSTLKAVLEEVLIEKNCNDWIKSKLSKSKFKWTGLEYRGSISPLKEYVVDFPGKYDVDPDGLYSGGQPFLVHCSFPDNSTIIGKDVEIQVGKCNEFQCFEAKMDYEMPIAQMKNIFALSGSCVQKIDFKCKLAPLKVIETVFTPLLKCAYCKRGPFLRPVQIFFLFYPPIGSFLGEKL